MTLSLVAVAAGAQIAPAQTSEEAQTVRAGVGVEDATWHVGASAGQYASLASEDQPAHNVDPYGHELKNAPSYGIQSRLSIRALVVEGTDGTRVALVKNDLYIPQDLVNTRVAAILEEHDALVQAGLKEGPVTGINHSNMAIGVSHNHTSPYYSTPSWGVWAFQDVFDIRFFEYLAQAMADAVIEASAQLVPVRMGASLNYFDGTQKHSFGPAIADDGTPAGYPHTDNDTTISVVRFDDISDPGNPKPLANFVTLGDHPESLEGNNLISGDYLAPLERMADMETGALTVFMQNNTGTAEQDENCKSHPCSARAEFSHREYAQAERGARLMADTINAGFKDIEDGTADHPTTITVIPYSSNFPVMMNDKQFAPPYSHPYPSVSNCRTHEAATGNPGVPIAGLPDCERRAGALRTAFNQIPPPLNPGATYQSLKEAGVPIPENYPGPSYTGLQETFQVHLQAIRLGEILITVCPCEQWSDQSKNIKSRADKIQQNMYLGYDWFSSCTQQADGNWTCPHPNGTNGLLPRTDETDLNKATITDEEWQRMRAQVINDAAGWDAGFEACSIQQQNDGECPVRAESEPADISLIKGNYTQSPFTPAEWTGAPFPAELPAELGYDLVLPVGMANDYWGYIATYREYQRGDHYRKALTGLGAHSSDFLATRLVTMGGALKGGPDYPYNALDRAYMIDGQHQRARAEIIGRDAEVYVRAYDAQVPTDPGPPAGVEQPKNIQRFDAAQFTWIGGSNYVDIPQVTVQRRVDGDWVTAGDMSGEVVVTVDFPEGDHELALWRAGLFEWKWTAIFEAFDSEIETGRGRQTPSGTYRFVVEGSRKASPASTAPFDPYSVTSENFEVSRWEGITVPDIRLEDDGTVSFTVGPVSWQHPSEAPLDGTKAFFSEYPKREGRRELAAGPIDYPDTWEHAPLPTRAPSGNRLFPRIQRTVIAGEQYCFSCTFRPWVDVGEVATATLTIEREGGTTEQALATFVDGRWRTEVPIYQGDRAYVERAGIVDTFGEINGERSAVVEGVLTRPASPTTLEFTEASQRSGQYTDSASLQARLTDQDGNPISGAPIVFTLTNEGISEVFTATTDGSGIATTSIRLNQPPGNYDLTAAFEGNEERLSSLAATTFTITKEDTSTSLSVLDSRSTRRLVAKVVDADGSTGGVVGVPVLFYADTEFIGWATTDSSGTAEFVTSTSAHRRERYTATFEGDDYFLGSSATRKRPW